MSNQVYPFTRAVTVNFVWRCFVASLGGPERTAMTGMKYVSHPGCSLACRCLQPESSTTDEDDDAQANEDCWKENVFPPF